MITKFLQIFIDATLNVDPEKGNVFQRIRKLKDVCRIT